MSPDDTTTLCAYPGCSCEVDERAPERGGIRYCSEDCADGTGCDHATCQCGVEA